MQNITLPEKIVITVAILLLFVLSFGGYYFYTHLHTAQAQNELTPQSLLDAVTKIAELPNEQPTIATVTDKEKLAKFTFFSQAQIGDKVLIYNEAKKAYLYRPSTNKIVEVGPIMVTEETPAPAVAEETNSPEEASVAAIQIEAATITLLNGTKGKGVASKAEKDLMETDISLDIKVKGNSKKNYEKTQVSVMNEEAKATAEKIAQLFNAELVELPKGELTPKTDIVVFLGTDRL